MRTDEELIEQLANQQFEAFEELARRHQPTAVNLAYYLLNDPQSAQEIAQEAFLKIIRNADSYEATASFKTYLSRVVSRLCYDRMEKNKPVNHDPEEPLPSHDQSPDPLETVLSHERQHSINQALQDLPARQRTAIVLQTFQNFSYEEIAESINTTKKAVERLLARAREALRTKLTDYADV